MGQLINIRDLGFWLFLIAPGIVMLVWLVVHLWRIDVKSGRPVDPPAEVEPVRLEQFARHTIDQLNGACATLGRSVAAGHASYEVPVAPTRLPVPKRSVTDNKDFIKLADKMYQLAELTSHMLEKRQVLAGTAIDPLLAADNPTPSRPYLSFTLDGELFAISTSNVCAIVEGTQLINKPATTSKLRRAIRMGNTLVPVIDLGIHLAGRPVKMDWSTCVVILEMGSGDRMQKIGVMVDAVSRVLRVSPAQIEQPEICDSKIRNGFILGSASVNNFTLTLLDIERGLSANEFVLPRSVTQLVAQENIST